MTDITEAKVKTWAKRILQKELPDVWLYSPIGGAFGTSGVPDQIGLWRGVYFAIEYKKDITKQPTKLQMAQLKHLERQGCVACVIKGKNKARLDSLLAIVKEKASGFKNSV